ncbi:MAG TPA: T9SS type A sorting domain-containing protein [bacterium]|mgnify:CR=1 FL=1|nr:T9SS type A sorting domain-containing protein [bacterium]HPN36023.1 T9SS type A sorting domain-containing protein [bacterium]
MNAKGVLRLLCWSAVVLFSTPPAQTADLELTGQWPGGPATAIGVNDSAVFIGHGGFLSVYHTRTFAELCQFTTSGYIRTIAIAGQYAYVAATEAGLLIVDISDPSKLTLIASVRDVYAVKAVVHGRYAYIATGGAGLRIIDVSQPQTPKTVADYKPESWVDDVALDGRYAFLACNTAGLCVADVQNPAAPAKVLSYASGYTVYHVAASGRTVFICGANDVKVTNFTDIQNPKEIVTLSGSVVDAVFQNNIAYLVNTSSSGVDLHDLKSATVKKISNCYKRGTVAVAVQPGVLYAAVSDFGFSTFNVSDPSKPAEYGKWIADKVLKTPFMVNGYMAFPQFGNGKLRLYDVQDVLHPRLADSVKVFLDEYIFNAPYVYHTSLDEFGNPFLLTTNLDNALNPVQESKIRLSGGKNYLVKQGDSLFTYSSGGTIRGFELFSLANPKMPKKLAFIKTETPVRVFGAKDNAVYCIAPFNSSTVTGELYCLDIADTTAPKKSGVLIPGQSALSFSIHDHYGIAYTTQDSVILFDLKKPLQPERISTFHQLFFTTPVFVGNTAYCPGGHFVTYDVSDMRRWRKLSELQRVDNYLGALYYPPYFIRPTLNKEVYVTDVSNQASTTLLGDVRCTAANDHIEADDRYLYLIDSQATLHRFGRTSNALISQGARVFKEFNTNALTGLQIVGTDGYVAETSYGHLHKIALHSNNLNILSTWSLGDFQIHGFTIAGSRAYVRSSNYNGTNKEFRVYDISRPQATLLGSLAVGNAANISRILLKGNHAFVNDGKYLRVLDIANPAALREVGTFSDDVNIDDMTLSQNYIYLGSRYGNKKIRAVNISNPAAPTAAGVYNNMIYGTALCADDRYLYVAGGWYGLNLLDFSAPTSPVLAARYYLSDIDLIDVAVCRDQIFILDKYRGVMQFKNNLFTSICSKETSQPERCALLPNYPNPFNAGTTISFTLPQEERVKLSVFNLLGQRVADLLDGAMGSGVHKIVWQAEHMPSGLYFCTFEAGAFSQTQRMLLLK